MKEIEIDRKPKIINDKKWCGIPTDDGFKECRFLVYNEDCCFFLDEKEEFISLGQEVNQYDEKIAVKCDKCKEAYQEAKSKLIQIEEDHT